MKSAKIGCADCDTEYDGATDGDRVHVIFCKVHESAPAMKKALEDIANGMVPHAELDGILQMTADGKLAEARGALYGWCQRRAREALALLS